MRRTRPCPCVAAWRGAAGIRSRSRDQQEGGARFLREGAEPEGLRGGGQAFRPALHPAQSRRTGRHRGLQGLHRHAQGEVPQRQERDQARLRRRRLRDPARPRRARAGRAWRGDHRHLPAGERQDRRALGCRAADPGEAGEQQRNVLHPAPSALPGQLDALGRMRARHDQLAPSRRRRAVVERDAAGDQ